MRRQRSDRAPRRPEDHRTDPGNWHWGVFYVSHDDPRPIVRHRRLFGWTWNFGHPHVLRWMALLIIVAIGPMLAAMALRWPWYVIAGTVAVSIVIILRIAHTVAASHPD